MPRPRRHARNGLRPCIGSAFLQAGPGFGGWCLPKDVAVLVHTAAVAGYDFALLRGSRRDQRSAAEAGGRQIRVGAGGDLAGAQSVVWGLTFKAKTTTPRESPAPRSSTGWSGKGRSCRLRPGRRPTGGGLGHRPHPGCGSCHRCLRGGRRRAAGRAAHGVHEFRWLDFPRGVGWWRRARLWRRGTCSTRLPWRRSGPGPGSGSAAHASLSPGWRLPGSHRACVARSPAWRVVAVDNYLTGPSPEHRRPHVVAEFSLVEHDVINGIPGDGALDAVCTSRARRARSTTSPIRSPRSKWDRRGPATRSISPSRPTQGSSSRRPARSTATRSAPADPRAMQEM